MVGDRIVPSAPYAERDRRVQRHRWISRILDMQDVTLIANPVSGSGRSRETVRSLSEGLRGRGYEVREVWTELSDLRSWLDPVLGQTDAALVVGGDGTLRMVAESLVRCAVPCWQVPCGTENLFARGLGMSADEAAIHSALDSGRVRALDAVRANGSLALLMASVGFDAAVVHDLSSRRSGTISHWTYLPCILRQLAHWRPTRMSLSLDDLTVLDGESGWCFVCNSREYGARFDPAPQADMSDGLLDVVFLPTRSRAQVLAWMARARSGRHLERDGVLHARAQRVRLEFDAPVPWQLDGDMPPTDSPSIVDSLSLECLPGVLPVLVPSQRA